MTTNITRVVALLAFILVVFLVLASPGLDTLSKFAVVLGTFVTGAFSLVVNERQAKQANDLEVEKGKIKDLQDKRLVDLHETKEKRIWLHSQQLTLEIEAYKEVWLLAHEVLVTSQRLLTSTDFLDSTKSNSAEAARRGLLLGYVAKRPFIEEGVYAKFQDFHRVAQQVAENGHNWNFAIGQASITADPSQISYWTSEVRSYSGKSDALQIELRDSHVELAQSIRSRLSRLEVPKM